MLTFLYKRARPSMADILYSRSCLGRNRLDAVESRPRPLPSYFRQPFMRVCSLSPPPRSRRISLQVDTVFFDLCLCDPRRYIPVP